MKNYLKGAWMSFKNYIIMDIIFIVFIVPIINFGKDNLISWIFIYSIFNFILLALLLYSDFHRLGIKEKKPQYDLKPYPLKGFVYGMISLVPFSLLGIAALITLSNPVTDRLKHLVLNSLLGPVYWIAKACNESALGYIISVLSLAVICGLSYLGGNIGFYFKKSNKPGAMINKKQKQNGRV